MSTVLKGRIWQDEKDGPWRANFRQLKLMVKAQDWKSAIDKLSRELNDMADNFEWDLKTPAPDSEGLLIFETDHHLDLAYLILGRGLIGRR